MTLCAKPLRTFLEPHYPSNAIDRDSHFRVNETDFFVKKILWVYAPNPLLGRGNSPSQITPQLPLKNPGLLAYVFKSFASHGYTHQ